ncbi:MAG: two-component system, OmpR family, heavy metal sensor histidine kinase CusS [Bryobacterales bacterium]|jgi:heavy metal sensor kinase|nr:two-component system, OmpR family, heavy metal sensor histidine kinase CusS [Bryobacterales bacterium]
MRSRSIRFRLTVWYALVLTGALALFGGLIWLSLRQRLVSELDEDLSDSASRFEAYLRRETVEFSGPQLRTEMEEFCQALPSSSRLELRSSNGFDFRYPVGARASLKQVRTLHRSFSIGNEAFTLDIATSANSINHTLDLLGILLVALIPVVIAIACLGGAWLSRRALRPVDEITAAARAISIDNLSQRLPVPPTGDELERLTEVWNTMLARLDSAVTMLSQFAADASHELRTPLAVIRTSAELALRRAREPESYRESLAEVVAESERMTQLVEDLLFLARSDSGTDGMPMVPLDLRDALGDAVTEVRDLATERHMAIGVSLPAEPVAVHGNRAALRRLFLALLDNALKYSPEGSEVKVSLNSSGSVAVEDSGIGIGPAELPSIFQRFFRADKARSNGGHGLGLSLAQTLARLHGASIDVTSAEGEGSVFWVRFPVPATHTGG